MSDQSIFLKVFKIFGVGLIIWGLSLTWPEINLFLTLLLMVGLALVLRIAALSKDLTSDMPNQQLLQPVASKLPHSFIDSRPVKL